MFAGVTCHPLSASTPRVNEPSSTQSASLSGRAKSGLALTTLSQLVKLGCQVGSVVILSRLLRPEDFGLVAMVTPLYTLAFLLQDLGLTQATVQRPTITQNELSGLFWINVVVSAVLGFVLTLCSPLIATFYSEPRLAGLTAAFAGILFVNGLSSQHVALLTRQMRFGALSVIDSLGAALGLALAILMALVLRSYWALIVAPLVIAVTTLALSLWLTRWWPTRFVRSTNVGELVGFGAGVTGFNLFNFVVRNLDNILIGRFWGSAILGLYDRAYRLLLFPLQQINAPLNRIMIPILSRLHGEPDRYRHAYLRTIGQVMFVTQPTILLMIMTANIIIPLALGKNFAAATTIFMWLGLTALQQPISSTTGWLFITQGRVRTYSLWGAINAVTCAIAFGVGVKWGAVGVAAAYAITDYIPRLPILWWLATREGPVRARDVGYVVMPFVVSDILSAATVYVSFLVIGNPLLKLIVASLLIMGIQILVLLTTRSGRAILTEIMMLARSLARRLSGGSSAYAN